jgi:DNA transformation protein and related proteins
VAQADEFVAFVCDQLRAWGGVAAKRMFSARGLFRNGTLFALIRDDTLYLRTDERTVADYLALGMKPFSYNRAGRPAALDYHEVPPDVLDEPDALTAWAAKAYDAAVRRAAARPRHKSR